MTTCKEYVRTSPCRCISLITACVLSVTACGGGSSNESAIDTPTNTTESEVPTVCENEPYSLSVVIDDDDAATPYPPENAVDGDTALSSRWQTTDTDAVLTVDMGSSESLGAVTIKWFDGDKKVYTYSIEASTDNAQWEGLIQDAESSGRHSGYELISLPTTQARYLRLTIHGNDADDENGVVEIQAHPCEQATGQFSSAFPNEVGIELNDWYLSIPSDDDNSGTADSISEQTLANGYTNSEYFYASDDGGIVMRAPSYGYKTSENTQYTRVELREMLRRGDTSISTQGVNKNNWVFGAAPSSAQEMAGGIDGDLNVTLAVNQVTTTGADYQIGRIVIGQIHANDDEPIRLYYRKLPNNSLGSVYFAHESRITDENGDNIESYVEMIGARGNSIDNPDDGIALNEEFSYHINVSVNLLTVTISREGKPDVVANVDMRESGYDDPSQYQYFKVGVYHLNNTSDPTEYAQATFYEIRNSHTGYLYSE
ncbi:polysaccharide lyase family 7 protein [Alteromonas sp. 14N.309.X.WAT.G.H12]|uniref:polysaccharide lyase family 7 protein n=1 Tax=Alteromonas sp. 14N.309.X.WAT.G.H12 TaxID=3120824 RepID=UPI002FD40D35